MKNSFDGSGVVISEPDIAKLESSLRIVLPNDYRRFLLAYNGRVPTPRRFVIVGCNGEALVDILLGVNTLNDIADWVKELRDDLPNGFIPIGFDPGGNALLLDTTDGEGVVYYWDSGRHFLTSTDEENSYRIAGSFTDFVVCIRDPPDTFSLRRCDHLEAQSSLL